MQAAFADQGSEGIVKARAVEDQLMRETRHVTSYDLLPRLRSLKTPTMVICGDHDFIPIEIAEHIAQAIPNDKLVTIRDCGHFAFLERPDEVRDALDDFYRAGIPPER